MISTPLFNNAFNHDKWGNKDKIDFLLENIKQSEKIIQPYLDQIQIEFPQLTDHSILHSRMLWNYADIIISDNSFLNPLEAYILHISFLVHDAGMCCFILNNEEYVKKTMFTQTMFPQIEKVKKSKMTHFSMPLEPFMANLHFRFLYQN